MEYIKVCWIHDFEDEPQAFYCELDNERYETRKIEVYKDGSFAMASIDYSFGSTELSTEAIPAIDEINSDAQFKAKAISPKEFEETWNDYYHFLN